MGWGFCAATPVALLLRLLIVSSIKLFIVFHYSDVIVNHFSLLKAEIQSKGFVVYACTFIKVIIISFMSLQCRLTLKIVTVIMIVWKQLNRIMRWWMVIS